jgi:hypothetical protein
MRLIICICIAVILLAATSAVALTGNQLKENSDIGEQYPTVFAQGYFSGYVLGVADATPNLCIPAGVNKGHIIEVVRKYLKDHPEQLHLSGSVIVPRAFTAAWPCK